MAETDFLCALDLVDTIQVGSRCTDFQVWGWIIAADARVKIEEVLVECDGKGRYRTSFPQPRPDVQRHYPNLANSLSSGFRSAGIPVQCEKDEFVEVRVIARCNGVEHSVLTKRIRLVWVSRNNQLFLFGKIGPFSFPEEFDEDRLTSYPDCEPVFLVGPKAVTASARRAVQAQVPRLLEGCIFLDLLMGLVESHDIYIEYKRKYFAYLEHQIESYAIGRFDIYEILNSIVATIHRRLTAGATDMKPICLLTGKEQLVLIPLIGRIYPHAKFVYLRPNAIFRAGDWIVSSYFPLSMQTLSGDDKTSRYEKAWIGRSFERLIGILTNAGKYNVSQIDWSGVLPRGRPAAQLLSKLGLGAAGSVLSNETDVVAAAPSTTSSAKVPGYLQVLPEFTDASPIFVLGAGRSGTSAMVGAMNAAGIEGYSEGHLFPFLNEMAQRLWERYLRSPAPPPGLGGLRVRVLEAVVSTAFEKTYGEYGPRVWLDKTPDYPMIECIPLLCALFPRARFLMMLRHPVSLAESRRRKFGEPLLSAVSEWARCIKSWKLNKSSLSTSQFLEVDLSKLTDPSSQEELCSFMELDAEQSKRFKDYLAGERPELTRVPPELLKALNGLDEERRYNLRSTFYAMLNSLGECSESAGWDGETTRQIDELLGTLPEEYGYELHIPEGNLISLLLQWAKTLDEYRYTAEFHQKNAAYWAEQARNWKVAAEALKSVRLPVTENESSGKHQT